jgi:peroxiredoxin
MKQQLTKEKQEQQIARKQRQELKAELAEQYANRPRKPRNRRRTITFTILAIFAILAAIFAWLVLLPSPTAQPIPGVPIGAAAPEFTLPIYGGAGSGTIDLHKLRGHPIIINFWSESCPPCRSEVPFLQRTYQQYGAADQFTLIGINQADPKNDIALFGRNFKLTYPLLFDAGDNVNTAYSVTAIPTTYFIDSSGIVRSVFIQPLTPKTMQQGLASVGIVLPLSS